MNLVPALFRLADGAFRKGWLPTWYVEKCIRIGKLPPGKVTIFLEDKRLEGGQIEIRDVLLSYLAYSRFKADTERMKNAEIVLHLC